MSHQYNITVIYVTFYTSFLEITPLARTNPDHFSSQRAVSSIARVKKLADLIFL